MTNEQYVDALRYLRGLIDDVSSREDRHVYGDIELLYTLEEYASERSGYKPADQGFDSLVTTLFGTLQHRGYHLPGDRFDEVMASIHDVLGLPEVVR